MRLFQYLEDAVCDPRAAPDSTTPIRGRLAVRGGAAPSAGCAVRSATVSAGDSSAAVNTRRPAGRAITPIAECAPACTVGRKRQRVDPGAADGRLRRRVG